MGWYIGIIVVVVLLTIFTACGLIAARKDQKSKMKNKEACDTYLETNNFSYFFKVLRNTTGQYYVKVVIMSTHRNIIAGDSRITVMDASVDTRGYYVISSDINVYNKGVLIAHYHYYEDSNPVKRSRLGLEIDIDDALIDISGNIELEIAISNLFVAEPFYASEKIGVADESERIKLTTNKSNIKQVAKTYNYDNIYLGE